MLFIITGEVDERIIANLMGFLEATESMEKFKTDDLELTALNDGIQATVTIPLTHQEMIDDLIDLLVSKLLLQVLYLYSDKAGNNFHALAYSMPYQDEMYVVRIASHQCGIIDEIHVDFYASIETVFTFLKQELERLEQPQPDLDIEELQRLDALIKRLNKFIKQHEYNRLENDSDVRDGRSAVHVRHALATCICHAIL